MLFKIFHILFLFSLYSIKGNECTEKTTFSDYDDEIRDNECESLSGKDYYCYYDYTKQKCEAIYCNDEATMDIAIIFLKIQKVKDAYQELIKVDANINPV